MNAHTFDAHCSSNIRAVVDVVCDWLVACIVGAAAVHCLLLVFCVYNYCTESMIACVYRFC
jgi:hypothetical protein